MTDTPAAPADVKAIERRWQTFHDRGAHDYTDEGCRVLAEHAFRDVPALLAALASLLAERDEARAERDEWRNSYARKVLELVKAERLCSTQKEALDDIESFITTERWTPVERLKAIWDTVDRARAA